MCYAVIEKHILGNKPAFIHWQIINELAEMLEILARWIGFGNLGQWKGD